jgi:hypothetical protein
MRVKSGADASCLNLNRVARPRILAVDPDAFSARRAFTFSRTADDAAKERNWGMLREGHAGELSGVGDMSMLTWGLGLKLGAGIQYPGRSGEAVTVRLQGGLANSIFQGSILVGEEAFQEHFGTGDGVRVFLVDAPREKRVEIRDALARALADYGLAMEEAEARLAAFGTVENTYLSIFLALGGLGMVLGTLGVALVVARSAFERRGELALLRAVGFGRWQICAMLLAEHATLGVVGVAVGCLAACVAVLPAWLAPGTVVPFGAVALVATAIGGGTVCWAAVAAWMATRGSLLEALRSE